MSSILLVAALVKIVAIVLFLITLAALLTWWDRRGGALMQDRYGPNRADVTVFGRRFTLAGLLHVMADGLKFITKEDFVPPRADKLLYALAPIMVFFPPLVILGVVPFGDTLCLESLRTITVENKLAVSHWHVFSTWVDPVSNVAHHPWVGRDGMCAAANVNALPPLQMQIVDLNVGFLYVFALAGMGVVGATIAGFASDNKFSLMGAIRAASQLISYEVTMGLTLIGAMMTFGTIRPDEMARWQADHVWGIFVQPAAFILFFVAAVAECKRPPFDVPEGESEIVAGYYLEYSGMKFGMFYFSEYVEVATSSAIMVAVFLGGYNLPFLHRDGITIQLGADVLYHQVLPHIVVVGLQVLTFFGKVVIVCILQAFVRWALPRFRYDHVMRLGWRMLLPASLANIFVTGVVLLGIDRASQGFQDGLSVFGDVVNITLALTLVGLFVWFVVHFFSKADRNPQARVIPEGHTRAPAT